MTERQTLERLKELRKNNKEVEVLSKEKRKELHDLKTQWMVFWRNNPNLYIHYKLGIRSFPYQHMAYYEMGEATTYVEVSTRGVSKLCQTY